MEIGGPKLLKALLMGLVIMYSYASISFIFFQPDDACFESKILNPEQACANPMLYSQYVLWHIVEGLRSNGTHPFIELVHMLVPFPHTHVGSSPLQALCLFVCYHPGDWLEIYGQKRYATPPDCELDGVN